MTYPTSCLQCEDNDAADGQYGDHKDGQSGSGAMSASEPDLTQQVNNAAKVFNLYLHITKCSFSRFNDCLLSLASQCRFFFIGLAFIRLFLIPDTHRQYP